MLVPSFDCVERTAAGHSAAGLRPFTDLVVLGGDLGLCHVYFLCRSWPAATAHPGLLLRTEATGVEFS
jgi:hypothetical protein